jgi:hypothetical protein
MNSFNYFPAMNSDHLSVEVNSDGFFFSPDQFDTMSDVDLSPLFGSDLFASGINIAGVCESADLVESINHSVEPNEFDQYLGPKLLSKATFDIDQNLLVANSPSIYGIEKNRKAKSSKKTILLSSSVGVGVPQRPLKSTHTIEIVNELEEKYRPRYKSDYFAQNGTTRKPRYVTDRHDNHYVTLKIPIGIWGKIRVDWLTIANENGERYYMPYRFQADNQSIDIPDCNPIFLDIVPDISGTTMKVYLVLIKAKQDALKSLQPLQPFHPMKDALGIIDKHSPEKMSKLTPKKLIQKYQLGKSQLAFTLCALGMDGQTPIPQWDTTVYSTVLEEESTDSTTGKMVTCPNCSSSIPVSDEGIVIQELPIHKRKSLQIQGEKPKIIKKQKSFPEMVHCVD